MSKDRIYCDPKIEDYAFDPRGYIVIPGHRPLPEHIVKTLRESVEAIDCLIETMNNEQSTLREKQRVVANGEKIMKDIKALLRKSKP